MGLPARSGRGRPVRPDAPILVVGRTPWWESCGLVEAMEIADWAYLAADSIERARWLASIRRISLIVIGDDRDFRWGAVEQIRGLTDVPMVVLTDDPDEVVSLVKAGVDAVSPPAEPSRTMLARLAAAFRRADRRRGAGVRYLRAADLEVDLWTRAVSLAGEPVSLSPTEYDLLTFLMSRPSMTLPTSTIVRRVWDPAPADGLNALRIIVNRVRRKLGDSASEPRFIASVRGSGYRFVANVAEMADSLTSHAAHLDETPLLTSVTRLVELLVEVDDERRAAEELVALIDAAGLGDGLAVFRIDRTRMRLLASARMSDTWLRQVENGVPLDPSFASAHSVLAGEVVQFADVRTVTRQFGSTAASIAADGFRACHFVPIEVEGTAWGHLGLVRRTESPLDAATTAYLGALCATFGLYVTGRGA